MRYVAPAPGFLRSQPDPPDRSPAARGPGIRPLGGMSTVSPDLFLDARSVSDPGERALALVRIAQTAIFSRQLDEAHTALFEAGPPPWPSATP